MWTLLKNQYKGVWEILKRYWCFYGGLAAILLSPYFHASVFFALTMTHYWLYCPWWDVALSALPTILGFTLAGFTIWLGFGDEKFRRLISIQSNDKKPSPYMGVSSGFAHFVIVQITAFLTALWAKGANFKLPEGHWLIDYISWLAPVGNFIGFLLFIYAIMTALAATLGVFRAASWYDRHRQVSKPTEASNEE